MAKKTQSDLAAGMSNLTVEEKVNVRSKNLDVLSEYKKFKRKKAANFVVIGKLSVILDVMTVLTCRNQATLTLGRVR